MIFVTVGLIHPFTRLVRQMDLIAKDLPEPVVMQIGPDTYRPRFSTYFSSCSRSEMKRHFENARLVVCHAGIGSMLDAATYNKPIILVPRRKSYSEHIDDHQQEIARELELDAGMTVVYDEALLESAIRSNPQNTLRPADVPPLAQPLRRFFDGEHL